MMVSTRSPGPAPRAPGQSADVFLPRVPEVQQRTGRCGGVLRVQQPLTVENGRDVFSRSPQRVATYRRCQMRFGFVRVLRIIAGVLVILGCGSRPASAQVDFSGIWMPIMHEDSVERAAGPDLGDYLGLPIN